MSLSGLVQEIWIKTCKSKELTKNMHHPLYLAHIGYGHICPISHMDHEGNEVKRFLVGMLNTSSSSDNSRACLLTTQSSVKVHDFQMNISSKSLSRKESSFSKDTQESKPDAFKDDIYVL